MAASKVECNSIESAPSYLFPTSKPYLPKFPDPYKTVPLAGNQMFNSENLWRTFQIQATMTLLQLANESGFHTRKGWGQE